MLRECEGTFRRRERMRIFPVSDKLEEMRVSLVELIEINIVEGDARCFLFHIFVDAEIEGEESRSSNVDGLREKEQKTIKQFQSFSEKWISRAFQDDHDLNRSSKNGKKFMSGSMKRAILDASVMFRQSVFEENCIQHVARFSPVSQRETCLLDELKVLVVIPAQQTGSDETGQIRDRLLSENQVKIIEKGLLAVTSDPPLEYILKCVSTVFDDEVDVNPTNGRKNVERESFDASRERGERDQGDLASQRSQLDLVHRRSRILPGEEQTHDPHLFQFGETRNGVDRGFRSDGGTSFDKEKA